MSTATDLPPQSETTWQQVIIEFTDYIGAERLAAERLHPLMDAVAGSWWFIRKAPCWRLRYLPAHSEALADIRGTVARALDDIQDDGGITSWVETIYEPETHAFGGTSGMTTAHQLFHNDSKHILGNTRRRDQRRELTILLCSTLLRGAGQDWYEQGDIWARVAENRPHPAEPSSNRVRDLGAGVRRLLTIDASPTSPLLAASGQLADVAPWVEAFHSAGDTLSSLARRGELTRGPRAVLTHHVIFHWNRIGLPYETQCLLAHAAKAVILGDGNTSIAAT